MLFNAVEPLMESTSPMDRRHINKTDTQTVRHFAFRYSLEKRRKEKEISNGCVRTANLENVRMSAFRLKDECVQYLMAFVWFNLFYNVHLSLYLYGDVRDKQDSSFYLAGKRFYLMYR